MKTNAWAFLVSRNESVDYRTIVAPEFIDAAKLRNLLTKAAEGNLTPPDKANIRWIQGTAAGDFSIVFRVIKARAGDIGETSRDILQDDFGRDIYLVEGLVFREPPQFIQDNIKNSHLEQAHAHVQAHYQQFWDTNETAISDWFPLQEATSSQSLKLEELEPIVIAPKSRKIGKARENIVSAKPLPWEQMTLQSNFLPILVTAAIVFILFSLVIGQMFGGANITGQTRTGEDCSYVTLSQKIPLKERKEWLKTLEEIEKNNKPAALFVTTVPDQSPVATPNQLSATQEESTSKQENNNPIQSIQGEPTFKQDNNDFIHMNFHPLQLAIMQLQSNGSKKFEDNTALEVRIIKPNQPQNDTDQCLQRLYTS